VALAQDAAAAPTQKAVGSAETQIVPSLIVLNAHSASPEGQKLTLNGVAPSSIIRPRDKCRKAGFHALQSGHQDKRLAPMRFGILEFIAIPRCSYLTG
jgi:hypothetical protein